MFVKLSCNHFQMWVNLHHIIRIVSDSDGVAYVDFVDGTKTSLPEPLKHQLLRAINQHLTSSVTLPNI